MMVLVEMILAVLLSVVEVEAADLPPGVKMQKCISQQNEKLIDHVMMICH